MVDLTTLLTDTIAWNTGFWGTLIGWFNGFINSYGWTIILFTLAVKLILSPLDFLQRKVGFDNAMAQAKMAMLIHCEVEMFKKAPRSRSPLKNSSTKRIKG